MISKIDKIILSEGLIIEKEGINEGHGYPIKKNEIFELFKMERSMCKILSGEEGSGFFCEFDNNFPIKYALFTNNHVLNEFDIKIGSKIKFEYFQESLFKSSYIKKEIEINENRRILTNKELDYTCIELFESDGITNYFKILPQLYSHNRDNIENNDIFILQFPHGNDISFSEGKIQSIRKIFIKHDASTEVGSSGSPIIIRNNNNYIIGLHRGGIENNKKESISNIATAFDSIIDDIKKEIKHQINEINCI